jgi:phenylalanyl-tRNA synthetase beta chain
MKIPVSWLREFVEIPEKLSGREVSELLLKVGFEVEGVDTVGDVRGALVIGRVKTIEELTDYKKPIRWCQVEVGAAHGNAQTPGIRGIVCGARNFVEGDTVVIALPGTTLPGDFTIATRETYGHISDGMICSVRELGLGDEHDGILVLPSDAGKPGDDAFPVLGLGDEVLDISVTPDRGYALSMRGMAREVAISQGVAFVDPGTLLAELPEAAGSAIQAASDDYEACDLLVLRTLGNYNPAAPTPDFIKARLAAVGVRSISLAVDLTNYVMFELGQPLHAFDADKITGTIRARWAKKGEELETLDGVKRTLSPTDLVIADDARVLSLAGVMGGAYSEISATTTRVCLEAAHFNPVEIARVSRRHKLSSEASRRLERGVDRMLPPVASARFAALLLEHGGATFEGTSGVEQAPNPTVIAFDPAMPGQVAGHTYEPKIIEKILTSLGCIVDSKAAQWNVRVPSWRPDLVAAIDLVEEVIRIDGYEKVPASLPTAPAGRGLTPAQKLQRRVGLHLAGRGLVEVRNYPFVGATEFDALGIPAGDSRRHAVQLANALSDEQPLMRTTLLPGLAGAVSRNLSRGFTDIALFEISSVSLLAPKQSATGVTDPPRPTVAKRPSEKDIAALEALLPEQPLHLGVLMTGALKPAALGAKPTPAAWNDVIEVALALGIELGVTIDVAAADYAPWHPGRCAALSAHGVALGYAGELAPKALENLGLPKRSVALELNLSALLDVANVVAAAPSVWTFPVAKEDIALVVKSDVAAIDVLNVVRTGAGDLLEDIRLFDVYEGSQVAEGHKSLAFALRFRAQDRTLAAEEVAAARQSGVDAAAKAFGATLR